MKVRSSSAASGRTMPRETLESMWLRGGEPSGRGGAVSATAHTSSHGLPTLDGHGGVKAPKNGLERIIVLPPPALQALSMVARRTDSPYAFTPHVAGARHGVAPPPAAPRTSGSHPTG